MTTSTECRAFAKLLVSRQIRVVFAESCTAGLVSASLARVPGISDHLCGSAVTYRNDTKHGWLGVPAGLLERPGPVSRIVAEKMAAGVLRETPEADWAASITGHLGPDAPKRFDGIVYIGIAHRGPTQRGNQLRVQGFRQKLTATSRVARQREGVQHLLARLRKAIQARDSHRVR